MTHPFLALLLGPDRSHSYGHNSEENQSEDCKCAHPIIIFFGRIWQNHIPRNDAAGCLDPLKQTGTIVSAPHQGDHNVGLDSLAVRIREQPLKAIACYKRDFPLVRVGDQQDKQSPVGFLVAQIPSVVKLSAEFVEAAVRTGVDSGEGQHCYFSTE